MNKTYLAYIAGFVDGEGCVTLSRIYRKDMRNNNPKFVESVWGNVQIGMAHIPKQAELLKEFRDKFGGYYAEFTSKGVNQKDTLFWRLTSHKASEFLKIILPYLRVKHRQAEIVIRMQELTKNNRGKKTNPSEEEMQERQNLINEIRILNKRGL